MPTENPIEVARETLRQLSARKLPPTPEHFERVFNELAHIPESRQSQLAFSLIRAMEAHSAPSPTTRTLLAKLLQTVEAEQWEQFPQLTIATMQEACKGDGLTQPWGKLINDLIHSWEARIPNLPQHFKQSGLERVLINYGNQPTELNQKLHALVANWGLPAAQRDGSTANGQPDPAVGNSPPQAGQPSPTPSSAVANADTDRIDCCKQALAYVLTHGLAARLTDFPDVRADVQQLIDDLLSVADMQAFDDFLPKLRGLIIKLELHAQQEGRISSSLANLLKLVLDNIACLHQNDSFLVGQISSLRQVLSEQPLSMQHIYQLESSLRDVIRQQGELKSSLDEATSSLRTLLNNFISRLSLLSTSTDDFQHKIVQHSERLQQTTDLEALTQIIAELVDDTAVMQTGLHDSHHELLQARQQAEAAEKRIQELEQALASASAKVQEDQLTGAYNRRGLAEHFHREISRTERTASPLCVALLDVDNFKQLNDHYGHLVGDNALIYLVDMIRLSVRPADIVARFGGEEFILLMPDTSLADAMETLRRLQRELTKAFFLTNNDRLVITFSAGVAQWHEGERDLDVIERADQAMYQAKLAGKNRVCNAETHQTGPEGGGLA